MATKKKVVILSSQQSWRIEESPREALDRAAGATPNRMLEVMLKYHLSAVTPNGALS